jgi:hypothetical protein
MLKKSLIIVACLAIIFSAFIAMQPSEFLVSRSIKITATPAEIFAHVNNQKKWQAWSPWIKLDPKAEYVFEGPDQGIGSIVKWSGNREIGKGSSEIVESKTNEFVKFKLVFEEPMKVTDSVDFTFTKQGKETLVVWTMNGEKNFVAKAFGLFCNCQEKVGEIFDEGLANLKNVSEKKGK